MNFCPGVETEFVIRRTLCIGAAAMEFDRYRYFAFGVILFLLGMQFRMVDSFVLNEASTKVLYKFAKKSQLASNGVGTSAYMQVNAKKTIAPPNWLGYAMLSAGSVVCLHSLALPKKK